MNLKNLSILEKTHYDDKVFRCHEFKVNKKRTEDSEIERHVEKRSKGKQNSKIIILGPSLGFKANGIF